METDNRRAFLPLLAPTSPSAVFFLLIFALIHGRGRPTITPSEEFTILIVYSESEPEPYTKEV